MVVSSGCAQQPLHKLSASGSSGGTTTRRSSPGRMPMSASVRAGGSYGVRGVWQRAEGDWTRALAFKLVFKHKSKSKKALAKLLVC